MAQHNDRRVIVGLMPKPVHLLKCLAAHDEGVDRIHEYLESAVLSIRNEALGLIQSVDRAVTTGNEPIKTCANIN